MQRTMRSNRVRASLMALVAVAAVGRPAPAWAKDADEMITLSPQTLKFTPIPDMPSCASAAILRGDPRSGPAWVLLKLGSGCRVPWHWHTANETLLVVSGRGTLETKDGPSLQFTPGAYAALPNHHVHQARCARACLLFNTADAAFDIHYVDAKGAEISSEKALQPSPRATRKRK